MTAAVPAPVAPARRRPSVASNPGGALVVAAALWAGGGLIGRGAPMSGPVLAFWRSLLGAVIYLAILLARGRRLRVDDLRTAAVGGLGFGLSVALLFAAYKSNVVHVMGTKHARRTLAPLTYQAAMLWLAAAVTAPVAWMSSGGRPLPGPGGWWWVLALIAVGGSGHLVFSAAQRHLSVAASSSILLLEVVLVAAGAAVAFDQSITGVQAAGMAVVAASVGVWLARTADLVDPAA